MTHPRPRTIIPPHRLTWCALSQAVRLADLLVVQDDDAQLVRDCIVRTVREGDLYATAEAIFDATLRDWVTPDWRGWADRWLAKVRALITSDMERAA